MHPALALPVDSLGPIRDWGLAPPPQPEQPAEPIHEDFSNGLTNWMCDKADWRQDIAGVRTGSLALLRPSLSLSDYDLEFLCKIENRSIGWVFRAADANRHYALQIALDTAGTPHLARYCVMHGAHEQPAIVPLGASITKNSSCRVKLSVRGCNFRLLINEKPAFEWSDDRLSEGGVGFFSEGDDKARLYWVKVTPFGEARADELFPPMPALRTGSTREIRIGV
jgi:hypothetical protein